MSQRTNALLCLVLALMLSACGSLREPAQPTASPAIFTPNPQGSDIVLYALGLLDTGYRFGGRNPAAGLDCSGMVSHIYQSAVGLRLNGSAADMAKNGRPIERNALRPGDLVFFNTLNRPYSHVGIYIGDERFIHAPSSNGKVRIDQMNDRYYAQRFEAARTYFD